MMFLWVRGRKALVSRAWSVAEMLRVLSDSDGDHFVRVCIDSEFLSDKIKAYDEFSKPLM